MKLHIGPMMPCLDLIHIDCNRAYEKAMLTDASLQNGNVVKAHLMPLNVSTILNMKILGNIFLIIKTNEIKIYNLSVNNNDRQD